MNMTFRLVAESLPKKLCTTFTIREIVDYLEKVPDDKFIRENSDDVFGNRCSLGWVAEMLDKKLDHALTQHTSIHFLVDDLVDCMLYIDHNDAKRSLGRDIISVNDYSEGDYPKEAVLEYLTDFIEDQDVKPVDDV